MTNTDFINQAAQVNAELEKIYADPLERWKTLSLRETQVGRCLSIPCFLKVQPAYFNARPKVVFVGQETHGWWTDFPDSKESLVASQITNFYQEVWPKFFLKYRSPYWQAIRKIARALRIDDPLHSFLFTNVFPCDVDKRQAPLALHSDFRSWKILPQELRILAPDYVIFFCGREYFGNLESFFGAYPVEYVSKQTPLVRYKPDGVSWQGLVTYHPAYLRRSGKWSTVLHNIVQCIGSSPYREPVTLEELECRANEVESGNIKPVSSEEFDAHIARLRESTEESR